MRVFAGITLLTGACHELHTHDVTVLVFGVAAPAKATFSGAVSSLPASFYITKLALNVLKI